MLITVRIDSGLLTHIEEKWGTSCTHTGGAGHETPSQGHLLGFCDGEVLPQQILMNSAAQVLPKWTQTPPSAHRDRASIPTLCSELCGSPITSCALPDNPGWHFLVLKIFTSTRVPRQSAPAMCLQCKWRTFLLPSSFNCSRSHPRNGKRNSVTTENEVFFFLSFEGANKSQGDIYRIIKGNTDECSSCNFSFQSQNPFKSVSSLVTGFTAVTSDFYRTTIRGCKP